MIEFITTFSAFITLSEPVGGSAPKFSSDTKTSGIERRVLNPLSLRCPAQGSPIPAFRFASYDKACIHRACWWISTQVPN